MSHSVQGPSKLWGLSLTRAIGLLLVPLVIVGVFLWGLWDPAERLSSVTAAVVNNDEPVEVEGQLTPLGRVLAAELIGETESENFSWVLTDTPDAADGLASGEYVTVVTIPANFSAAATSLVDGPSQAEQATITVETSERAKLLDAALSAAVTQTATRVLNAQLGEAFVGNVFVGMKQLGDGLEEASGGADLLADGTKELSGGTSELATGLHEFAVGTEELSSGVGALAGGTEELASGLRAYALGVEELADGTTQAAAGSAQLSDGVTLYTETINEALIPIKGILIEAMPYVEELRVAIVNDELPLDPDQKAETLQLIEQVKQAPAQLDDAIVGGQDLAAGARASAAGLTELADGAWDLAAGANGLAGGAGELSGGTQQLAGQMPGLVDGAAQLAAGADLLADGAEQTASGSKDLAEGLAEVVQEIPRYTDAETDKLAKLAVTPVSSGDDKASLFSGSGAPLFLSIALWAGALAAFLLITPLWSRTRDAALSEASITVRSTAAGALIGVMQGVLGAFLVGIVLDAGATAMFSYLFMGGLVGLAFALINQGLVALFGGGGRFVAFLTLLIAFVAGIVSTAPALLSKIAVFTPIGASLQVFHNIAERGTPGFGASLMIVVWAALGFIIVGAAVHRARRPAEG